MKDSYEILLELLQTKTKREIADSLNVNLNTVTRWVDLKKVPKQYYFELCKLANIEIDYSQFSVKEKDQFYTNKDTVIYCVNKIKEVLNEYGINFEDYKVVEPSAGDGAFLVALPEDTIALDIEPNGPNIIKQDFLDWKPEPNKYITVGNPPFGLRGHLALKFINHAATFSDFVCFILPPLFDSDGKGSPKKRVQGLSLLYTEDIPNNYHYPDGSKTTVNTIFQIWTKLPIVEEEEAELKPNGYKVYSLSDGGTPATTRNKDKLDKCHFYLPSTCFGEGNMRLYNNFEELPQRRGYGILLNKEDAALRDKISKIVWKDVSFLSTNNAYNLRTSLIVKAIEK